MKLLLSIFLGLFSFQASASVLTFAELMDSTHSRLFAYQLMKESEARVQELQREYEKNQKLHLQVEQSYRRGALSEYDYRESLFSRDASRWEIDLWKSRYEETKAAEAVQHMRSEVIKGNAYPKDRIAQLYGNFWKSRNALAKSQQGRWENERQFFAFVWDLEKKLIASGSSAKKYLEADKRYETAKLEAEAWTKRIAETQCYIDYFSKVSAHPDPAAVPESYLKECFPAS